MDANETQAQGRQNRRAVLAAVFAIIFIDLVGHTVLIPVLPLFAEGLGASDFEIGLIFSLYALAQLLFLPLWGWISDRIGRRPVLIISMLGTAASFAALALAARAESIAGVYAARAAAGFFAASIGCAQAVVTDITAPSQRTGGMGGVGAALSAGMIFGPALGGALVGVHPQAPFYGVALLSLAAAALAWFALPETRPAHLARPRLSDLARSLVPTPVQLFLDVHDRRVAAYLALFFVVFTGAEILVVIAALYLARRFGYGEADAAIFFAWAGIIMVLTQGFLLPRLGARFGEARLLLGGLALAAGGIAALAFAPNFAAFFALGGAVAVGQGLAFPPFTSLYTKLCKREETGELLGHSNAMAAAGRVCGALAGGALMQLGLNAPFLAAGALIAGALLAFVLLRRWLLRAAAAGAGAAAA